MESEQLELLKRVALALGVTPYAVKVRQITVGRAYMERRTAVTGRAWQLERNLLRPFVLRFWRRLASSLGPGDWNAHRAARRKQRTRLGRPPCELTLNLELAAAKRLVPNLKACRPVKTRNRRESWFTADQIDQLLGGAEWLRWDHQRRTFRALVAVMADTGLRISEALSLRWDRITLRGTTSVLGKGAKTGLVAFTPRALEAMAALERGDNPYVFANRRSGRWNASTVRTWFRAAVAAAGLEGVKADGDLALVPHCLRHSAASIADERGAPATWIQQMLRHSSLKTTQAYLHRSTEDAAIRMAGIMGQRRGPQKKTHSHEKEVVKVSRPGVFV